MRSTSTIALALAAAALLAATGGAARGAPAEPGWRPPVGIPAPDFGLFEVAGAPTHVVDVASPAATDEANPRGTPERPRRSIPRDLAAGSVVDVRGGPYPLEEAPVRWAGTRERPVFVRGAGKPRFPRGLFVYDDKGPGGGYVVIEGLDLHSARIGEAYHHVALRGCEVRGDLASGGLGVGSHGERPVADVVVFRNEVHDNGDWKASFDQDRHGIAVGRRVERLWILENRLWHNSGDGVQINGGRRLGAATHHVYVGRNVAFENKQCGFWTKQAADVIFSQNEARDHRPSDSSPGAGMGFQYAPERVWFIFNRIHGCEVGIAGGSDSGLGAGRSIFAVGNLIHAIHRTRAWNPRSAWAPAAMRLAGGAEHAIVANTIVDVDAGIHVPHAARVEVRGNIIGGPAEGEGRHIFLEHPAARLDLRANVLGRGAGGDPRIRLGGRDYTVSGVERMLGWGAGNVVADPGLAAPERGDFRPAAGSAALALAGAAADPVVAEFRSRYGIDIAVDLDGRPRPGGAGAAAGALEPAGGTAGGAPRGREEESRE